MTHRRAERVHGIVVRLLCLRVVRVVVVVRRVVVRVEHVGRGRRVGLALHRHAVRVLPRHRVADELVEV